MRLLSIILFGSVAGVTAAEFKEGTFTLAIKRGELEQTVLYTRKGEQLRLEYPGKHIPAKPSNLIDTRSGEVKIVRPLNSTWTLVPAKRLAVRKPSAFPEPPAPPAGTGARPGPAGVPGTPPAPINPDIPATPPQPAAPQSPAGAPAIPEMPTPTLPDGSPLPNGIGPQPGAGSARTVPGVNPGQPAVPGGLPIGLPAGIPTDMPMMPGQTEEMKLSAGKESKTIHGYLCQRYVMTLPGEGEMTLWLSDAADLPPFHLPLHEAPRARGRVDWLVQWPAVLRERKLFPMLAILRVAPEQAAKPTEADTPATKIPLKQGREIARWEITDISAKPISDQESSLFAIPLNYHQMESPDF